MGTRPRNVIQISGSENRLFALAHDGTVWELNHSGRWEKHDPLPPIQFDEEPEDDENQLELPVD